MLQSILFTKTQKNISRQAESKNHELLTQAGFIDQTMAGVYSYLPLGIRVINNIEQIVREEMNKIQGQEVLMPALHPKEFWQKTNRWNGFDALFKIKSRNRSEYALGPTHEEVLVPLCKKFVHSYKDLPFAVFQIQNKFRDEPRAKAGILRGREFIMKDLYSFHADQISLDNYYEKTKSAYFKVFNRCKVKAILTLSSGGTFSKYSHEFQVETSSGEDIIYFCSKCDIANNQEIIKIDDEKKCQQCGSIFKIKKTSEVGNIFKLGTKYSAPFELKYLDKKGKNHLVIMGCYGIGISRLMGIIVENNFDNKGIIWPENVAPFKAHLLQIGASDNVKQVSQKIYQLLTEQHIEILYDDRQEIMAGEKFADSDLIGCPYRLVVSEKTLKLGQRIELKPRVSKEIELLSLSAIVKKLKK